uniref:DH domain-containing protein n=1 Tax=Ditylenchus dipsaci TaxID=166011 RepID=A0A915E3I4_9BILA
MTAENDELLSRNEISTIFGKIPSIIQVHADILDNLTIYMKMFREKGTSHCWASALEMCDQTRHKFHSFLKMAESKKECQKNSLKDMLIRPVQRIPSVLLLLQELLKKTDKSNQDYKKTNESRRKVEIYTRSLEVCNQIEDISPELITGQLVLAKNRSNTSSKMPPGTGNNSSMMSGSLNGSLMDRSSKSTLTRQMTFSALKRNKEKNLTSLFVAICSLLFAPWRSVATEFHTTGSIRRPSQLRRAVSSVSINFSHGLQRFTSKSRLNNIGEMHERSIRFH